MSNILPVGQKVQVIDADKVGRRLAVNFPGWGAEHYLDFLLETEDGMVGVITMIESHGMNPWTRYSIKFEDGTRAFGVNPVAVKAI